MKWTKTYIGEASHAQTAYISGEYMITKKDHKNIFTGRQMSETIWNIYKNGERVDYAFSLKNAKAIAERSER